ncbi:sulfotransferase [Winogradskyella sp. MH6]|uniref:sulfotransferase n=1 Tax=Winogradskyella sp. MH6 TaxID=2929510 RepID=UPI001FB3F9E2|nr:sulfotransferase [Winogradskyella sp. MH6]
MTKDLPNFLIVGAAKAATTTIHEYLKQHPEVFMTEWKEPSFFKFKNKERIKYTTDKPVKFITKIEDYKNLFKAASGEKIRGESSTPYLYFYEETIQNIKETITDYENIKILIVLRNPIERAFSQYMMKIRDVVEDLDFMTAIKSEPSRMKNNAHFDFFYVDRGMYYRQVKAYLSIFKDVKVLLYDDFKQNPDKTLNDILNFLELKNFEFKKIKNQNISGKPKSKELAILLKKDFFIKRHLKNLLPVKFRKSIKSEIMRNNLQKETISLEAKIYLQEYYKSDIQKLQELINRDLSNWLL